MLLHLPAKDLPAMNLRRVTLRLLAYTWALPNTAIGLALGSVMLALGGKVKLVSGVFEFHGGVVPRFAARLAWVSGFGAITFGHAILGACPHTLDVLRAHERVHVSQYERWGALFVPVYLLASVWAMLSGLPAHQGNTFERQACSLASPGASPWKAETTRSTWSDL